MRIVPLLFTGLLGTVASASAQAIPAGAYRTGDLGTKTAAAERSLAAPVTQGPGEPLRRLCAAWPEGPPPLLQAPFRAPPLRYVDGALRLELGAPAAVEDGSRGLVEILPADADEALSAVPIAEGARLVRAQAAGQIEARIAFYPERERLLSTPCFSLSGGRVLRVRAQPLWVSLWQGGKEQARLYTERGEGLAPEGRLDAQFDLKGMVFDGDAQELEALRASLPQLLPGATACYQKAIGRRPDVAGRIILGADLDRDGRASGARVEVDAIGDSVLSRCLRDVLAAARLPRTRRTAHLSVPMVLRRVAGK